MTLTDVSAPPNQAQALATARRMNAGGWSYAEIARYLTARGYSISDTTVGRWLDRERASRELLYDRDKERWRWALQSAGRLGRRNQTDQFKHVRIHALSGAGLSVNAIIKAMGLDYPDDEPLTVHRVRCTLARPVPASVREALAA